MFAVGFFEKQKAKSKKKKARKAHKESAVTWLAQKSVVVCRLLFAFCCSNAVGLRLYRILLQSSSFFFTILLGSGS